jgi:hypothetical protein
MPGPEGYSPQPVPKPKRGFFDWLRDRSQGSGVVGLDKGAEAELAAGPPTQARPESPAVSQPVAEIPTREEELRASADGRGWAGHKDAKYGEMPKPGAPQVPEAPATSTEQPDELREAA